MTTSRTKRARQTAGSGEPPVAAGHYLLELDLHLFFVPLMQEWGDGIVLTRTLALPFLPNGDIAIGGRSIEGDAQPLGYRLKNIVWDVDRNRFVATTTAAIASGALKSPIGDDFEACKFKFDWDDDEELCEIETLPASKRPHPFNELMSALVRMLFDLGNNEAFAYAMYKTKTYFELDTNRSPQFQEAMKTYEPMTPEQRKRVLKNVLRRTCRFG